MYSKHQEAQASGMPVSSEVISDLDDRLMASVAAEREASGRSNQQATSVSLSLYASVSG